MSNVICPSCCNAVEILNRDKILCPVCLAEVRTTLFEDLKYIQEDVPPEFDKTFKNNMRDILA